MKNNIAILIIVVMTSLVVGVLYLIFSREKVEVSLPPPKESETNQEVFTSEGLQKIISEPIANAKTRITKKSFGIYITPANSPAQNEKFIGYHTGTDFEITSEEEDADIPIYAICSGDIIQKSIVDGYGGVIVQSCALDDKTVTVLYGHLNIKHSQASSVGIKVNSGDRIGFLTDAGSDLSGGERKHLHLGIVKGGEVDYRGYASSQSELSGWIDIKNYL